MYFVYDFMIIIIIIGLQWPETDFRSLRLQRDCAMSVTNADALMTFHAFYSHNLDLDSMTLTYKTYLHTNNELGQGFQKL